jgi:sensor histidine kinase YesM
MIPLRPDPGKESGVVAAPLTGKRLFGVVLALATAIGFFSTLLLKLAIAGVGGSVSWAEAATGWIEWYIWAALTPLVVWLARTLPVSGRRWLHAVAGHALIGALICALELGLFAFVMTGYNELFMGHELAPWRDRYITLIGRWLPLQMLIYALIVAVVTAMEHGRRARERDVAAARLEAELVRTQVHALQAQIQPHFLFNALNTISMAVRQQRNRTAVRMMADLSGVLRRSIEAAVKPQTTLRRELGFVRHYLAIEQHRLEERLSVSWHVDRTLLHADVPTMVLQPLVENAVRHGISNSVAGGSIAIHARRSNGALALCVEDTGPGIDPAAELGVGIRNVRRRLAAQYGADASLTIEARPEGGTIVQIILPLSIHESTHSTSGNSYASGR